MFRWMGRGGISPRAPKSSALIFGKRPQHSIARVRAVLEKKAEAERQRSAEESLGELMADVLALCESRSQKTGIPQSYVVAESIVLHDPRSPKRKRYRGSIEISFDRQKGEAVIKPITRHGPASSPESQGGPVGKVFGQDLDKALKLVNRKLAEKQGRSYEPMDPDGPRFAEIRREDVVIGLAELLNGQE